MSPAKKAAKKPVSAKRGFRGARGTKLSPKKQSSPKSPQSPFRRGAIENPAATLLARAERLIERAAARKLDAEVYLEQGRSLDAELEKGAISGMAGHGAGGGAWRVVKGGRLGFAYFADDATAPAALEAAVRLSRLAPDKGFRFVAPRKAATVASRWDPAVALAEPGAALALARDLLAGAKESAPKASVSGGGVGLGWGAWAIANTEGMRAADASTKAGASVSLVLPEGERSISAGESAVSHRLDVDARGVGGKAGATIRALAGPRKAKGGRRDVILRPEAALELVAGLGAAAATGDEAMRGKTVWSGKRGERVAAPGFWLVDDPLDPLAVGGAPRDDEGSPTRRLPIVADGVLESYLFDAWDANEHKQAGTASAVRGGWTSRPATDAHHLAVEGPERSLDRLVAEVDEGFLVESVLGAHTANETTGEFSVTSPNAWRIHKGAVAEPVSDIAIAGSLPGLLASFGGVSKERKRMDGATMPHLLVRQLDVSV